MKGFSSWLQGLALCVGFLPLTWVSCTNTKPNVPFFTLGGDGDVEFYLADNLAQDRHGQPVPLVGKYTSGKARGWASLESDKE